MIYNPFIGGVGIVATGCVRTGTMYMAEVLNRLMHQAVGGCCFHETLFSNSRGVVERGGTPVLHLDKKIGESSYLAAPFLCHLPPEVPVIHLIREPLSWLRSFSVHQMTIDGYPLLPGAVEIKAHVCLMYKYAPEIITIENHLERGLAWWKIWNNLIEAGLSDRSWVRLTAEETSYERLQFVLFNAGIGVDEQTFNVTNSQLGRKINTAARNETLTWDKVPESHAKEAALELWNRYISP